MSRTISWDDQRIFLAVLEEGSLSAAARRLGVSQPTVRSRIAALETALGTTLFTRSVNGLTPTENARALREPSRAMALASEFFIRSASAPPGECAGTVRLSVSEFMGIEVIPPMLAALRTKHPGITVELELSNASADLLGQEVDIAVRTTAPKQNSLVARKVGAIPLGFFAHADYLERFGIPETVGHLDGHAMIAPDRALTDREMESVLLSRFRHATVVMRTDSHPAQLAAARAGMGIAVVQTPVGQRDAALRHVLPDFVVSLLETWVVTHEDLRNIPRVKAVFAHLVSGIADFIGPPAR